MVASQSARRGSRAPAATRLLRKGLFALQR
jgi:hypothetical protein